MKPSLSLAQARVLASLRALNSPFTRLRVAQALLAETDAMQRTLAAWARDDLRGLRKSGTEWAEICERTGFTMTDVKKLLDRPTASRARAVDARE